MTDITKIRDKLDRIYERTEEIGEFDTRDSEISGLLDDIGDVSETVEKDIEDLKNISKTYEEVIKQKQMELERYDTNQGFADKVLEKWVGGYTLPTALWKDRVRDESGIDHNKRKSLVAAGGLLSGGALAESLYGINEDNPEWQQTYQVLTQDNLDSVADDMTTSSYESLSRLGHSINKALDNHRKVALGLNPEYGDVGVRQSNFDEYVLQKRVDLPDTYDKAKELSEY